MANDKIVNLWNELKILFESVDNDVLKNASGNTSAGVRARRGFKPIKKKIIELTRLMIEIEKARKEAEKENS